MGNAKSGRAQERFVPEDSAAQYERDMAAAGHKPGGKYGGNSKDEYDVVEREQAGSRRHLQRQERDKRRTADTGPRMDPALAGFAESLKKKQASSPSRHGGGAAHRKKRIMVGKVEQLPGALRHRMAADGPHAYEDEDAGSAADPDAGASPRDATRADPAVSAVQAGQPGFLKPHATGAARPRYGGGTGKSGS